MLRLKTPYLVQKMLNAFLSAGRKRKLFFRNLFLINDYVFQFEVFYDGSVYFKEILRCYFNIFKSKVRQLRFVPFSIAILICNAYVKKVFTIKFYISHGDVMGGRGPRYLFPFQIEELCPWPYEYEVANVMTLDVFDQHIFVILWSVRTHFKPK